MKFLDALMKKSRKAYDEGLDRIEKLYSIAKGRVDIKSRLNLLLDPSKPQTTTYFTRGQVQFDTVAHFMGDSFDIWKPLKDYARCLELSLISYEGQGVENSVKFTAALEAVKILESTGLTKKETVREPKA